jgi:hypothetical protein
MGKSAGSGNASWRAAMVAAQIQPGFRNRRLCVATARYNGQQCRHIAMKGVSVCQWHGGRGMQVIVRNRKAKLNVSKGKRRTKGVSEGRGA